MTDSSLPPEPVPSREAAAEPRSKVRRTPTAQLYTYGMAGLVFCLAYYAYSAKPQDVLHLYLGLLMFVGAALPSLLWARRGDQRFPVFEVFMLTGINTYAIPLLSGHEQLVLYTSDDISSAALGVLLFQVVANSVYGLTRGHPKRTPAWTQEVISHNITDYLGWGMAITSAYTIINGFTTWIPSDLNSVLRAACFGVGIISTFIQARMWGEGTLPHHRKGIFILQLIIQIIFSWAALFLIGGMSILVLGLLGYVSGGRKIPVLAILVALPVIGVLHNGKSVMRDKYWEGRAPMPTITQLPEYYSEWIGYGLLSPEEQKTGRETTKVLDRSSLFHMMCLVVARTPSQLPFLEGETYSYLPGQFIPSFFWKDKPVAHVATNKLSIYYGLQVAESTTKTTIAFGLMTEAYANFGMFGIALLAATFAFAFKKFSDMSSLSPILSYPGLVLIVLMAWSFQTELTLAAWLSSFYQACVVILGIPFLMRNFIGQ